MLVEVACAMFFTLRLTWQLYFREVLMSQAEGNMLLNKIAARLTVTGPSSMGLWQQR